MHFLRSFLVIIMEKFYHIRRIPSPPVKLQVEADGDREEERISSEGAPHWERRHLGLDRQQPAGVRPMLPGALALSADGCVALFADIPTEIVLFFDTCAHIKLRVWMR